MKYNVVDRVECHQNDNLLPWKQGGVLLKVQQ